MSTDATPTDDKQKAVTKLFDVANTVAIEGCEHLKAPDNPDGRTCRDLWPKTMDDWCLACLAQQAVEEFWEA